MSAVDTNSVLNCLSVIHNRSLAAYLNYASPWIKEGNDNAANVLAQIASDHQRTVDRLGVAILENGGDVAAGEFPIQFTGWHDLSLEFHLKKLLEAQKQIISQLEIGVDQLRLAPMAQAMVQEILGEAKGHLDSLKEL